MMKLRIIDNFPDETISLELTESDTTEQFSSEPFVSPFSQAFLANFAKLFSSLPDEVEPKPHSAELMEKFIRLGQHLGDALLGENHTLNKFREIIEEKGYAQCDVSIESSRIAFFELPWEALILPESPYVLATTAHSFTRVFTPQDTQSDTPYFPDIQLDLNVTGPTQTQFSQMMGETPSTQQTSDAEAANTPLQVVSLCHEQRNEAIEHALAFDLLKTDTAVTSHIHVFQHLDALKERLSSNHYHVLSLSGSIALNDAQAFWVSPFDAKQRIPMQSLFELMQAFHIPLLVLNIDQYLQDDQHISANTGLAFVSYQAQQAGIGNIVGFNQTANAPLRLPCLSQLYRQISKGFTLAQAVVETRKALQAQHTDTPNWPLLSHYGLQNLRFFASAPPEIEAETAVYAQQIHQQLFGFIEDALPPYRISLDNGEFVSALAGLQQQRITCVNGEEGTGKTLLTHQLAFYAVESGSFQWAFRFDFSKHEYQANDMLQMIAPVLKIDAAALANNEESTLTQKILSALENVRCLFVLDGLNSPKTQAQLAELITALNTQQQGILITQNCSANTDALKSGESARSALFETAQVEIASLTPTQCLTLTLTQLTQSQAQQGQQNPEALSTTLVAQLTQLLQQAQLNPWLGIRLGDFLGSSASGKASDVEKAIQHIAPQWQKITQNNQIKANYYQWQWSQLTESAQQLLLICSQFDDVLLEMLMVAWEREADISQPLSAFLAQPIFNDVLPSFSAMIKQWQRQGFIKMRPHGHVIDADCVAFLAQKRADAQWLQNPALQTQVSRLLCAGLRILADHVLRQQNPAIYRNLLNNRALWAKHLQTLWHSDCFAEFIKTKATVSQLMQQAQLGHEFATWAHKLTQEIALPTLNESSPEASIAWLSLATSALEMPKAANTDTDAMSNRTDDFTYAAEQAQQWLLNTRASEEQKLSAPQLALMQHTNQFLGLFYAANASWENAITCHQHTAESFKIMHAWPLLASVLSALANAYVQNQQHDAARECEQRILSELPYEHAPKGYRSQKLVDIILSRIQRVDIEHIPDLLNELKASEDANRWQDFIKGVEADIDFAQERWEQALPYYAKMWQQALQSQQVEQANILQERLNILESHLGKDLFSTLLEKALEERQSV